MTTQFTVAKECPFCGLSIYGYAFTFVGAEADAKERLKKHLENGPLSQCPGGVPKQPSIDEYVRSQVAGDTDGLILPDFMDIPEIQRGPLCVDVLRNGAFTRIAQHIGMVRFKRGDAKIIVTARGGE